MLARLQRTLVLALLALAGAWCWFWWQRSAPLTAAAGALAILLIHAPVLALEFVFLHLLHRDDPAPKARLRDLVRAWAHEVASGVRVFGWRQPFRSHAEPDHLPPDARGRRAVVLVHGFVCNRGLWNPWMKKLRALDVPFVAVDLEPVFGSIDGYVDGLDRAVECAARATGEPPLVVAHSMGGLAVRAWLRARDADARVAGIVTIGTPHRGTWLGRFGYALNAREMRLESAWLKTLSGRELPAHTERYTCFYSACDNIVFPPSTATLPGADNRHVPGSAHVQLIDQPAVYAGVLERLGPNVRSPASTTPGSMAGASRTSR